MHTSVKSLSFAASAVFPLLLLEEAWFWSIAFANAVMRFLISKPLSLVDFLLIIANLLSFSSSGLLLLPLLDSQLAADSM